MAGYGESRPWEAPAWKKATFRTDLHQPFRCKDEAYNRILRVLRTAKPKTKRTSKSLSVSDIVRGRKAWRGQNPSLADVTRLWKRYPNTTMLAVTRRGAALLNELSEAFHFGNKKPLAIIDGDIESNPLNYDAKGKLKKTSELKPLKL